MKKWADRNHGRRELHAVRRERILQEAARCFSRRGYHGTTIHDIARQLHVSTAALYYYFKSKEELLFQCHQISLEIALEGLRIAEESSGAADDRLRLALQYYIEHVTDALKGCVGLLEEGALNARRHREIVRRRDAYEERIRRLLAEGIASKTFVRCDPKMVGLAILGVVNWVPKWYRPGGRLDPKAIGRILSTYLVRGLRRVPGTASDMM
jgi:TetR/AcrR family transcriptional regulator